MTAFIIVVMVLNVMEFLACAKRLAVGEGDPLGLSLTMALGVGMFVWGLFLLL